MWCNTCLVCHACFSADAHRCKKVAVHGAYEVCEDVGNNSADNLVTPCKTDKKRGVARMQAKLVMAAQSGKLHDWTKATLSHCLDVMGVKLPSGGNRRQAKDIAMRHALPLLAQWDAFVHGTDRVTRFAVPPSSSQPCCSQVPIDDMDGLINK